MPRASHIQRAGRLNLARTLLQQYRHWPEAAQQLARNCSISERQAYRYLEQAQRLKHPVPVGDVKVSFTVKLSRRLVERLRAYAADAVNPSCREMKLAIYSSKGDEPVIEVLNEKSVQRVWDDFAAFRRAEEEAKRGKN